MATVPRRQVSSQPAQPPRGDGLRALVELASDDAAGPPERFLLPNGPREAAALVAGQNAESARTGTDALCGLLTTVAVVAWVFLSIPFVHAAGPAAAAWPAVFVAVCWTAARGLVRAHAASCAAARTRGRSVALSRNDSKRIACRAAAAAADLLQEAGTDQDAAFERYHRVLVSLSRFELAAGQAVAADRDRARLAPDDPLRSVAGQMAQDRAARAVAHRSAARADADWLQAARRSRREQEGTARPPATPR